MIVTDAEDEVSFIYFKPKSIFSGHLCWINTSPSSSVNLRSRGAAIHFGPNPPGLAK